MFLLAVDMALRPRVLVSVAVHDSSMLTKSFTPQITCWSLTSGWRQEQNLTPYDKLASGHQAKPPGTSTILRNMPHRAAGHASGNWRPPPPDLGAPQPDLRSHLPGLCAPLTALHPDIPGLSAPLSGRHVPPPPGRDGLTPRG